MKQENKPVEALTYESALSELEGVISTLEDENVKLEDSLLLYQRGQALVAHCAKLIENAELKLEVLSNQLDIQTPDEELNEEDEESEAF